jgi:hypothetical protein
MSTSQDLSATVKVKNLLPCAKILIGMSYGFFITIAGLFLTQFIFFSSIISTRTMD